MFTRCTNAVTLLACVLLASEAVVHAEPSSLESFALLIGSNAAGDGQSPLAFAQTDAKQMATVIQTLGQIPKRNIRIVLGPNRKQFHVAVAQMTARLRQRHKRGL